MLLKQNSGNVTLELIIFFLLIATATWLSVGIFEANKTRTTLDELAHLAARQIAINSSQLQTWQNDSFVRSLEIDHNLKNLQLTIDCENKICKNGSSIEVAISARSANGVFAFDMKSKSVAVSSRFSSD